MCFEVERLPSFEEAVRQRGVHVAASMAVRSNVLRVRLIYVLHTVLMCVHLLHNEGSSGHAMRAVHLAGM